jgi:trk system potassium uptake protein TrkA
MRKQFAIIGLGNFGYHLATSLFRKGHEVMAIDKAPELVQRIKDDVTHAIVADATDAKAMESLNIKDVDTTIVCIGSVLSDSILVVLNLEEIGVKRIFAKAISTPHVRILKKLGVMEILFPEKDIAISLAERLHNPNLIDYLPFMEDYGVIELEVPKSLIGKTLREADMINRFGVQVVAIKEIIPERINFIPTGNFVLKDSDIMILLGTRKGLDKLREE